MKVYASFLVWHYLSEEEKVVLVFVFYSESCGLKGVGRTKMGTTQHYTYWELSAIMTSYQNVFFTKR